MPRALTSRFLLVGAALLTITATPAAPASAHPRRAVVVGIDDYLAALPAGGEAGAPGSAVGILAEGPSGRPRWENLDGAVHDALTFRQLLTDQYRFPAAAVRLLTDRAATREAILRAIEEHLLVPSRPGDEVVFFFAGHGSQQENSLSDEDDKLDETIVPWDSARGAADVRDKELRRLFNRILDRGARLTVILDSCHSGSAARGLPPGARARMLPLDPRDAADGAPAGPRPEDQGALVLSAAQDFQPAWERWDESVGKTHGVFSRALFEAMARVGAGESAERVFLRAKARLEVSSLWQDPVLAGNDDRRHAPFFGGRADRALSGPAVAVREVRPDGALVLQGGWASGLAPGLELALRRPGEGAAGLRIRVTRVDGPASAEARLVRHQDGAGPDPSLQEGARQEAEADGEKAGTGAGPVAGRALEMWSKDDSTGLTGGEPRREVAGGVVLEAGDLFEPAAWVIAAEPSLKVWIPQSAEGWEGAVRLARALRDDGPGRGVEWIEDPLAESPTHLLSRRQGGWRLEARDGASLDLGPTPSPALVLAELERAKAPRRLFVHLPVPAALAEALRLGAATENSAVERTPGPEGADYFLVGRLGSTGFDLGWVRPGVGKLDEEQSALPLRSDWFSGEEALRDAFPPGTSRRGSDPRSGSYHEARPPGAEALAALVRRLEDMVLRLARIRSWLTLESPPEDAFPYHLALRGGATAAARTTGELVAGETYGLLLRAHREDLDGRLIAPRYAYVFTLDSFGKSTLLYPRSAQGGVENRYPRTPASDGSYPTEISLGTGPAFRVSEPFGTDTYFLITTVEPIATPTVLEFDGVRRRGPQGRSVLEELLSQRGGPMRGSELVTPLTWSLERLTLHSRPAGK
jgi:hypothetical protein